MQNARDTTKNTMLLMPLLISFIALAVQWGVVTTKLDIYEERLEKNTEVLNRVQEDVSFIKGSMQK